MNEVQGLGVSVKAWATAGLVPGIRLRVTATELAAHLRARAEHHRQRAKAKAAEVPKLKQVLEAIRPKSEEGGDSRPLTKVTSNSYHHDAESQVEALERDIRDHETKAFNFDWQASHLFDADYCLDRNELTNLEILKQ